MCFFCTLVTINDRQKIKMAINDRAFVLVVMFALCIPIFAILGALILHSHVNQSRMPIAVCDFTDANNVSHASWQYNYGKMGGKGCSYGSWTVQGYATYFFNNQSYVLNVTGMFPAPLQPLNLECSDQCDVEQRSLALNKANCSLDLPRDVAPDVNSVYYAYPKIISAVTGIVLIVFAGVIFFGFLLGCFVGWLYYDKSCCNKRE